MWKFASKHPYLSAFVVLPTVAYAIVGTILTLKAPFPTIPGAQ